MPMPDTVNETANGSIHTPESMGLAPRTFWKYSGRKKTGAIMQAPWQKTAPNVEARDRLFKMRRGITG